MIGVVVALANAALREGSMLAFATGWLPPVAFKLRPPELTFDPGSVG